MRKIPVLEVVRYSYRFLIEDYPTILRVAWFPLLAYMTYMGAIEYREIDRILDNPSYERTFRPYDLAGEVFFVIIQSIIAVALHQRILFHTTPSFRSLIRRSDPIIMLFIYFGILIIAFIFGTALIVGLIGNVSNAMLRAPIMFFSVISVMILLGCYLIVRLWLIYPIMVIDRKMNFRKAIGLSKGTF